MKGEKLDWSDILKDPNLQNLPYKVEQNEKGQIVMRPFSNEQGLLKVEIVAHLKNKKGKTIFNCSIQTSMGVKVADMVWLSK